MIQLKQFFQDSKGEFVSFFNSYTKHFFELTHAVDINSVEELAKILLRARERGATIFIIGNGGSAATASHFAEDMALCAGGGEHTPFRALSLSDGVPYMSALGMKVMNIFFLDSYEIYIDLEMYLLLYLPVVIHRI
jgi:D-sedoheptulose 7-phosphate isomerase